MSFLGGNWDSMGAKEPSILGWVMKLLGIGDEPDELCEGPECGGNHRGTCAGGSCGGTSGAVQGVEASMPSNPGEMGNPVRQKLDNFFNQEMPLPAPDDMLGSLTKKSAQSPVMEDYGKPMEPTQPEQVQKPAPEPVQAPKQYDNEYMEMIVKEADRQGVPRDVALAIARQESNFNPKAQSPVGAQGMYQLMPGTAKEMGVTDPYDPEQSIRGGIGYIKKMYDMHGDWDKAFASYNAGPGNVQKYGGVPPFPETQNYVKMVNQYRRDYT